MVDRSDWRDLLVGDSPAMLRTAEVIERVAARRATVLITGETGSGKEMVARALHQASPRAAYNMVVVNAAALPEHLIEAELFGHIKGAFREPSNIAWAALNRLIAPHCSWMRSATFRSICRPSCSASSRNASSSASAAPKLCAWMSALSPPPMSTC